MRRWQDHGAGLLCAILVAAHLLAGCGRDGNTSRAAGQDEDDPLAGQTTVVAERLPDFRTINNARERKRRFFAFMRPIIEQENRHVRKQRARLISLHERFLKGKGLAPADTLWLRDLAVSYKLDRFARDSSASWQALLMRVDEIPPRLALAQAAKESAWGTSRFARQGNAVFGQWCYIPGRGLVPARRDSGAVHEVARFATVNRAVRSYLRNLNTHPAYGRLRRVRAEQRAAGKALDSHALAAGLVHYSERRETYVAEIRDMLHANRRELDAALRPKPPS